MWIKRPLADLPETACRTRTLHIHGHHAKAASFGALSFYGSDAPVIRKLISEDATSGHPLDSQLPYLEAEVVWAARMEMARTVEDVLARRTRALFLNARAAIRMAPRVAGILAKEMGKDQKWEAGQLNAFNQIANGYLVKA